MKPLSLGKLLTLNSYWFGISFMWNSLHVIILPAVLLGMVSEAYKNTWLGLLTMVGLIIAMIVQPLAGAASDGWVSKWGRRRPLILIGSSADFIFLALLAWAGGLGWLALGYLGLQVTSNLAHGAAQGLIPDLVPSEQTGRASAIKNLIDMIGLVISSLLVGRLLAPGALQPVAPVAVIAAALAAVTLITMLGVREAPALRSLGSQKLRKHLDAFFASLRPALQPPFGQVVLSRFLFLIGVYGIQVFAQYYVRDVLGAENPIKLTGDLLAAITLSLVAFALAGGWLGDRIGHRRVQFVASAIGVAGCLLLNWARSPALLLGFGIVLGVGIGLFLTSNWALAIQHAPLEQAAKYMGLTNLATAGAGALSRLQGPLIDGLNAAQPGAWWGYTALFSLGALGIALSAWVLNRINGDYFHSTSGLD
jgi:MFS family permease